MAVSQKPSKTYEQVIGEVIRLISKSGDDATKQVVKVLQDKNVTEAGKETNLRTAAMFLAYRKVFDKSIARMFGLTLDAFAGKYQSEIRTGKDEYRFRIHTLQMQAAEQLQPAILIFLGKAHLKQSDKPELEKENEGLKVSSEDKAKLLDMMNRKIQEQADTIARLKAEAESATEESKDAKD